MSRINVLFKAPDVQIGEFRCPPGDPLWRQENSIGVGWHVVFPGTGVVITHSGGRPIVANPNHTVFYDDAQTYQRELLSEEGDRCVFLIAKADLIRAVYRDLGDRERGESEQPRFAASMGPLDNQSYLLHRRVVSYLRAGQPEQLRVREALYGLLCRSVGAARRETSRWAVQMRGSRRRRATLVGHGLLVDDAKRLLSTRFDEPVRLDDLAGKLYVSPYHLCRIFRERTGWSIHGYLTDLRLRSSLERLPKAAGIATLAVECGFSSHGHFTAAFAGDSASRPRPCDVRRRPERSPNCAR